MQLAALCGNKWRGFLSKQNQDPLSKKIFFKFFVKTGCVSASQFQISEGIKIFLRFRVCIRPLPVGISEGSFQSKQNKAPATEKYFLIFLWNRVSFGFVIPNKWRAKFFLKKFSRKSPKMGVHLDTPCANKWKGISNSQIFFPFRVATCRFSVGISEGLFHSSWKLNDRPKDTNRHDFAERQTSAWAEKTTAWDCTAPADKRECL